MNKSSGKKRSYQERRIYLIEAVRRRRKKVREMAIAHKGMRCERCGYDRCLEALEFHHIEKTGKDFGISARGYTRSWEKIKNEIGKCILLCANCHREIHVGFKTSIEDIKRKSKTDSRKNDALTNPVVLQHIVEKASAENKTSTTLKGIVEKIVALKPQRGNGQ